MTFWDGKRGQVRPFESESQGRGFLLELRHVMRKGNPRPRPMMSYSAEGMTPGLPMNLRILDGHPLFWRTVPRLPMPGRTGPRLPMPGEMGPGLPMDLRILEELRMPGEMRPGLLVNFCILETSSLPMDGIWDANSDGG